MISAELALESRQSHLLLDVDHGILDLAHRDLSAEVGGHSEVLQASKKVSLAIRITNAKSQLTRPFLGSEAAIMFLASNICWVSSATETARNDLDPGAVSGA